MRWTGSRALLAEDLAAVDALIHQHMTSPVGVIPNLAAHLIDAGGKRIRPLITLGGGAAARRRRRRAAQAGGGGRVHPFRHAAARRRGRRILDAARQEAPPIVVWGNSASVLVGDFLFARSFNLMVETGDIRCSIFWRAPPASSPKAK